MRWITTRHHFLGQPFGVAAVFGGATSVDWPGAPFDRPLLRHRFHNGFLHLTDSMCCDISLP
jgi:hypothetical protein